MEYWNTIATSPSSEFIFSLIFSVFFCFIAIIVILFLIEYILFGISIYKTAVLEKTPHPWLSWVPFARKYLFGKSGDFLKKQQNRSSARGITLLVLSILRGILIVAMLFITVDSLLEISTLFAQMLFYPDEYYLVYYLLSLILPKFGALFVLIILLSALSIWNFILTMMNFNTLYQKYAKKSVVPFTVIAVIGSIFGISFLAPMLLLIGIRKGTNPPTTATEEPPLQGQSEESPLQAQAEEPTSN